MKPLFFLFTIIKPFFQSGFWLFIILSIQCFGQVDKLKMMEIRPWSKFNFAGLEGYTINMLSDGNDIKKLKENYENLIRGLDNLKLVLSDSCNNINKDSIRNQVINQLERQQTFLEDLSKPFDNSPVGEAFKNHSQLLIQTKDKLPGNFTTDGLKGILDESRSKFHESFKEKIGEMFEGTSSDNFLGSGMIGEKGETLTAFLDGFDEPIAINNISLNDTKHAVSSRINRKVGFENIEYKEVIVKANPSLNPSGKTDKILVSFLYNLNDGISISSLLQGSIGLKLSPNFYAVMGGSFRMGNPRKPEVIRNGYGVNFGVRKYFFLDWYMQGVYERNYVEFIPENKRIDLGFKGFVDDLSVCIGKEIKIMSSLFSIVQANWNPLFEKSTSLQGSQFVLKVGIGITAK